MKRCFTWSAGLALLALIGAYVVSETEDARAGLITSALVGSVNTTSSAGSVSGNFLIINKATGRTMWQASSSAVTVSENRSAGTLSFSYQTGPADTANLAPGGEYEWVFRVDGRAADSSVTFQSFTQTVGGVQMTGTLPSMDLRNRIGEAQVMGQF